MDKRPKILITPLNWGLGHATRCIPIINILLKKKIPVLLASDGRALALLKKEFPQLAAFTLPAYKVRYDKGSMVWNIAKQLPKISQAILKEKKAIRKIVEANQIDIIISDNRYGCRSSLCKNIFISHQINIAIPNRRLQIITNKINHHFINLFDECWIPDFSGDLSLAGKLSQSTQNHYYIGPLSRFKKKKWKKEYDLIAVLSGPEPQRSIFEAQLIRQLRALNLKCLIVQGKTEAFSRRQETENLEIISFLTSAELNEYILKSELVLARSGYSTIMDLVALGKQAILIPTPGQTEQEYLAETLHEKGIFYTQQQDALNIEKALQQVPDFTGFTTKQTIDFSLSKFLEKKLIE